MPKPPSEKWEKKFTYCFALEPSVMEDLKKRQEAMGLKSTSECLGRILKKELRGRQ